MRISVTPYRFCKGAGSSCCLVFIIVGVCSSMHDIYKSSMFHIIEIHLYML